MRASLILYAMLLIVSIRLVGDGAAIQITAVLAVKDFVEQDHTEAVLRDLARSIYMHGLLGVAQASGTPKTVFVDGHGRTVGGVLDQICSQDPRYRWSEWKDPRMVNVIAGDAHSLPQQILDIRVSAVDIEADELAEKIIQNLVDYAPSLREQLQRLWAAAGGSSIEAPYISGMTSDTKISHFSLHLRDVTVREALNAVSLHSQDMYEASGIDLRFLSSPAQPLERPSGWLLRVPDPKTMTFPVWCYRIFEPLQ